MPSHQYDDALHAFDALQPGGTFHLTTEDDPKALLRRLGTDRPHQVEWSVLEAGPTRHRVCIRRRHAGAARDVSAFLGWDHERLGVLLGDVSRLVGEGAHSEAAPIFAEFACGLSWHIDAEETTVFPMFEERTGITEGPTTVLREEHRLIRLQMDTVTGALRAGDRAAAALALSALEDTLDEHNLKEEQVLYPMTDGAMTDAAERDALVDRIQLT